MTDTRPAGKLDWVAIIGVALVAISTLAAPVVYLNFTLHQMDLRLLRIEVKLGVDEPEIRLSQR